MHKSEFWQYVDYIVHTGDLIDWQSEANFDLIRKYFGDNMFGTMGNHEFTPDMWLSDPKEEKTEAFKDLTRDKLQKVYPFDISFQSQVVHGVNFITLDDVYGYVTAHQVQRFREWWEPRTSCTNAGSPDYYPLPQFSCVDCKHAQMPPYAYERLLKLFSFHLNLSAKVQKNHPFPAFFPSFRRF